MSSRAFAGPTAWLSNFYPAEVEYQGMRYPTVEHAYQASKFDDLKFREEIQKAATPGRAKRLGRTRTPQRSMADRVTIMHGLLRQKFSYPELQSKLLSTCDFEIVEHNPWGDKVWGVCDDTGENLLGKLLMLVRSEICIKRQGKE